MLAITSQLFASIKVRALHAACLTARLLLQTADDLAPILPSITYAF